MMEDVIKNLHGEMEKIGAGVGHIKMEGVAGDPSATAVLSVYTKERPAHEVLESLELYAEAQGNKELQWMIERMSHPDYTAPWEEGDKE